MSAIDEYIAGSGTHREALKRLRGLIREAAPGASESIRVRVPAFHHRGRPLASIGSAKDHVSLYFMYGGVIAAHSYDLQAYDTSNTVIRFQPSRPVPDEVVRKLIRFRVEQIDSMLD